MGSWPHTDRLTHTLTHSLTHTKNAYGWCPTSWPYQYKVTSKLVIIGSDFNIQSRVKSRLSTPGLRTKVPVTSLQVVACFCVARLCMQPVSYHSSCFVHQGETRVLYVASTMHRLRIKWNIYPCPTGPLKATVDVQCCILGKNNLLAKN